MALSVLMFRGNVFRAVLAGIPVIIIFLLISSEMAPLFTDLARKTPSFEAGGSGLITAFTDGGNPIRFLVFHLYQGKLWAVAASALLFVSTYFAWLRFKRLSAQSKAS
jgi:PTS system galactitol-specific IIC component